MKKKKLKKGLVTETGTKEIQPIPPFVSNFSNKLKISLGIIIAVFAFLLYAQSIRHGFTLDDSTVVQENTLTTEGISAIPTILKTDYWYGSGYTTSRGPIYRPTSLVVYAIVWQFFPANAQAFHFVNVLLYALTCLLLFLVLSKLFATKNLLFPFVCTLIFIAHPIHTEVVNSVKSLDEILCFLFGLIAIFFFLKYVSANSKKALIIGGISFFLSLISKETGITFLAIIPLLIFFYSGNFKKAVVPVSILLIVITTLWLIVRASIFQELPPDTANTANVLNNSLNAAPDNASKFATAFYILFRYIILAFFPHPLTYDYSYTQIKILSINDPLAIFSVVLLFALAIYAVIYFRKKNVVALGILLFLIPLAPVANIFFLTASTMAERFLYIPSVGFCIILTYLLIRLTNTETVKTGFKNLFQFFSFNHLLFLFVVVICALYTYKTTLRNKDWKDNLTLYSADVKTSYRSAKANQILGSALMISAMNNPDKKNQSDTFSLAKKYLVNSLTIYPQHYAPYSHLGVIYLFENKIDSAYAYLKKGVELMPDDVDLNFNYGLALFHLKKYDEAIKALSHTIQLSPTHENAHYNLAAIFQNTGAYDKAIAYYTKVTELNPGNANAYYNMSVLLSATGDTNKASEYMNKAVSLGYKVQ